MLRPYQLEAADAVFGYFERGGAGNPLIVIPTGGGKSHCLAELARRVVAEHDSRVVVLAHRKELLEQNADKLARMSPDLDIGAYSAGLNARDKDSDVLYCGIQSVYDKARSISDKTRPIELVFVDEAHLVPFGSGGMYRRFLDDLTRVNPHLRVIGCTATPWRYRPGTKEMSGGYDDLTGDGGVFTDVVYDCSAKIGEMIEAGYLAPLWPSATGYRVDAEKVATRNGDYCADELEALMSGGEVVSGIVEDAVPRARADGRKSWLVFCSGVKSALSTMEALRAHGVCAACVTGETPAFERDGAIEMFRGGRLEALVSVNVLGVGFDAPNADCLIFARPTVSPIIHIQFLGRGSRPTETKMSPDSNGRPRGCLVLDYVGNIAKHGPIDAVRIKRPAPKKPPPTRDCPKCEATVPIQARVCPACGADLAAEPAEKDRPVLNDKAIIAALDKKRQRRVETREITGADYRLHLGQSGRYTVRVDYRDGLMPVASEWLCFDHPAGSYARLKADKWFVDRVGHNCVPPPDCKTFLDWIVMGMSPSVPAGLRLLFDPAKKYPEILGHEWSSPSERAGAFEKAVA